MFSLILKRSIIITSAKKQGLRKSILNAESAQYHALSVAVKLLLWSC